MTDTNSLNSTLDKEEIEAHPSDGNGGDDSDDESYQEGDTFDEEEEIEESQDLAPVKSKKKSSSRPSSSKGKGPSGKKKSIHSRQPLEELNTGSSNKKLLKEHKDAWKNTKMVGTRSKNGANVVSKEDQLEVSHSFCPCSVRFCLVLSKSNHLVPYRVLQAKLTKANDEIQALEERIDRRNKKIKLLESKKEELQDKNHELNKALKRSTSKSLAKASSKHSVQKNESLAQSVRIFTQRKFWRFVKFIANPKQLVKGTYRVCELMQPNGYAGAPNPSDPAIVAAQAEFAELYAIDVREGTNKQRSYAQSETRKAANEWMENHPGLDLPSAEIMLACAERKVCY